MPAIPQQAAARADWGRLRLGQVRTPRTPFGGGAIGVQCYRKLPTGRAEVLVNYSGGEPQGNESRLTKSRSGQLNRFFKLNPNADGLGLRATPSTFGASGGTRGGNRCGQDG
jgi:hypothetical protein